MSEKVNASSLISLIIGFILIAVLIPVGLNSLLTMVLPSGTDPVIATLLQTLLPIMAILGIVMAFIPKFKQSRD